MIKELNSRGSFKNKITYMFLTFYHLEMSTPTVSLQMTMQQNTVLIALQGHTARTHIALFVKSDKNLDIHFKTFDKQLIFDSVRLPVI